MKPGTRCWVLEGSTRDIVQPAIVLGRCNSKALDIYHRDELDALRRSRSAGWTEDPNAPLEAIQVIAYTNVGAVRKVFAPEHVRTSWQDVVAALVRAGLLLAVIPYALLSALAVL